VPAYQRVIFKLLVGYITNKTALPVTQLNFGRTNSPDSYGRITLGKLECSGQITLDMPESCADLRKIGHRLSGLYSIKKSDGIHSVYCDFKKLPDDPGVHLALSLLKGKNK
jgi:hypothetical protein